MRKALLLILLLSVFGRPAHAQFFLTGEDPGRLRWYRIQSAHYEVVYPEGADSLARVYARLLEQFRVPMGKSIGETPAEGQRKKFPVVLHTHYPYSNGSVAYAPKRMDLYTMPEAYGNDPSPWPVQLAAHEPRHQAQLQLGGKGFMKPLPYLIGQAWNPIGWALYFDSSMGEGDAVVAETGLTRGGTRSRTADFLNYYRVALDQGDYRSWSRWYFGSYKKFTPDLYKISYMSVAAGRYLSDNPFFTREAVNRSLRNPFALSPGTLRRKMMTDSGDKRWKDTYVRMMDTYNALWQEADRARAPFQTLTPLTPAESFPVDYRSPVWADSTLYALRSGYLYPSELVRITEDGHVRRLHSMASQLSKLVYDPVRQRLYWTETRRDPRWTLSGSSELAFYDLRTGKMHSLSNGARYYSPAPSADGSRIAVVEYRTDGSQALLFLDAVDGTVLEGREFPSGVQFTEIAWVGEQLYALGVAAEGYGLWRLSDDASFVAVLEPSAQKVVDLRTVDGALEWTSDRTGVNELYRYCVEEGRLEQRTVTRYGAGSFFHGGGKLYCSAQTLNGKLLFTMPEDSLLSRTVRYGEVAAYPVEDALTAQEERLGPQPDLQAEVPLSAPARYSKIGHTRLHSWLPLYADYSAVMSGSFDLRYENAAPGVSLFFQNTLSTFSGMLGYAVHPDANHPGGAWRHALHLRATYSGWLPVFEGRLDIGDSQALQYYVEKRYRESGGDMSVYSLLRRAPLFTGSLNVYLPLQFQRHGMYYGVTPQLRYAVSNHVFARGATAYAGNPSFTESPFYQLYSVPEADGVPMQQLSASLRGFWMRPKATKAIYPRWGIGLETGCFLRPGILDYFAPEVYAYAYGYLPGLWRTQGWRLTATAQQRLSPDKARFGELAANTLPRGFSAYQGIVGSRFPFQWKMTADYAIPIYAGDIDLPAIGVYAQHFLLTPHFDFTGLGAADNLWSAGADFSVKLKQEILFTADMSLGVSVHYLGGSWFPNTSLDPWAVGLIFSVDL